MKKRILSIALVLCMVLALMPTVLAAEGTGSNDSGTSITGSSDTLAADGGATAGDVVSVTVSGSVTYYASLQEAMNAAASASKSANVAVEVKLLDDVDLSDTEWTGVDVGKITIDGQNHTIRNMTITQCFGQNSVYGAAFIWNATGELCVKNITFDQATVRRDATNGNIIGIVVGYAYGKTVFENVNVTGSEVWGYGKVGTLLGMGADSNVDVTFTNCESTGNTIHAMYDVGGLAGNIQRGTKADAAVQITDCKVDNTFEQFAVPDRNFTKIVSIDDSVADSDTCDLKGKHISGNFLDDGTYYWPTYAEYYCSYGTSQHDCDLQSGHKLANSEYIVGPVAEINGYGYTTLADAITAANAGQTVTLLKDVTLGTTQEINKDVTIDLGGHKITGNNVRAFKVASGKLTLTGEGTVTTVAATSNPIGVSSSVIRVGNDTTTATTTAELIVDKNVTIEAPATYGVSVFGSGTTETATVYGKIHSTAETNGDYDGCAISTLGTDTNTPATVNIMEGAELTATNTNAVYAPSGTLNISGGTITGTTGVYFKSTNMTISGGTITGNGEKKDYEYYGNGGISTGDALTIDSCNYPGGINAISVTGGTFISANAAAVGSYNSNGGALLTGFVTGGTFSTDPTAYVAKDYIAKRDGNVGAYTYTVVAKSGLTSGVYMNDPTNSTATNYYVTNNNDGTWTVYYVAPYVPPTTTTETTTNDDGSTTTTTTNKSTGTVTETTTSQPVTDEAGNTTQTTTETVTKKDGSSTETVTETVKAVDGSTTETVTETVTDKNGVTTSTETVAATDTTGTTATTVTETNGAGEATTTITAAVSDKAVTAAAQEESPVTLPVEVPAVAERENAIAITVQVPDSVDTENTVKVEIPVENLTTGTVAVVVNEDGTEEIIKTSTMGEDGVVLTLEGDTTVKIVDNSKIFEDVHPVEHWAEDAVTYVAAREIFNGTGNNNFSPDEDLTRAMLMTVLARYDGEDTTGGETWYEQGMNWAVQNGVSDGTNPEVSITREQMVTMLWRYFGSPTVEDSIDHYGDANQVSDWAEEAMRWAVSAGIINGVGNNTLEPQGNATRAQVATVMMRFCENVVK